MVTDICLHRANRAVQIRSGITHRSGVCSPLILSRSDQFSRASDSGPRDLPGRLRLGDCRFMASLFAKDAGTRTESAQLRIGGFGAEEHAERLNDSPERVARKCLAGIVRAH